MSTLILDSFAERIAARTKRFAIRILRACAFLEKKPGMGRTLSQYLLRSGTAVGAKIREAQTVSSRHRFIALLEEALKAVSETQYWLEILLEADFIDPFLFGPLLQEANTIAQILTASITKLKLNSEPPAS